MKRSQTAAWIAASVPALFMFAPVLIASDWSNNGGNAQRNALTSALGPDANTTIWTTGPSSNISWHPVIEGNRVFIVRQTGFPPGGEPNGSPIFALDLNTGAQLWRADIPYEPNDWTTWIAGARDGRVYAGRSGNGASVSQKLYALNSATGAVLWTSQDKVTAGPYDGVVFADDGDLIVADFRNITRINAEDGATVWRANRLCSVSSSCGGVIANNSVYIADATVGGHEIVRFDLATGARLYDSGPLSNPGFTLQNTPFAGPDGTIYLSRSQNNVLSDYFLALEDDGFAITEKWSIPARWTTFSEYGIGPDGTIYTLLPGNLLARLDPADGTVLNSFGPLPTDGTPPNTTLGSRMAIDCAGRVYYSNQLFTNGRLYSFNADLTLRWSAPAPSANIGGPSLASNGVLIMGGTGTNLRAYRTVDPCPGDLNNSANVDDSDLGLLLNDFGCDISPCECSGDIDRDGDTDDSDLGLLLNNFGRPCL